MLFLDNKFPIYEDALQYLVVETDKCDEDFTNYDIPYIQELLNFILFCKKEVEKENVKRVVVFKNVGWNSGGSIPHHHVQIVGLKKITGRIFTQEDFEGITIKETATFELSLSNKPLTQDYEFNLISKTKDISLDFCKELQHLIQFILLFKGNRYSDYNIVFEEIDERLMLKVLPRSRQAVYSFIYDIHQIPPDLDEVKELYKKTFQ